ncbi:MAG TPA: hypothetical protein VND92_02890, partial [Vicinamibacterales bacterium]|nr:hypothetical protein [Vicinamibacterales bacterium]
MRRLPFTVPFLLALTFGVPAAGLLTPASAQSAAGVSAADIQKLENRVVAIRHEIVKVRATDAVKADELMSRLSDLHDDVTYLKVKLRKEGRVSFQEYGDLNGRLEDFGAQVRAALEPPAQAPAAAPAPPAAPTRDDTSGGRVLREVPVGTELDAKLQDTLSSGTAAVEDRVEA